MMSVDELNVLPSANMEPGILSLLLIWRPDAVINTCEGYQRQARSEGDGGYSHQYRISYPALWWRETRLNNLLWIAKHLQTMHTLLCSVKPHYRNNNKTKKDTRGFFKENFSARYVVKSNVINLFLLIVILLRCHPLKWAVCCLWCLNWRILLLLVLWG